MRLLIASRPEASHPLLQVGALPVGVCLLGARLTSLVSARRGIQHSRRKPRLHRGAVP